MVQRTAPCSPTAQPVKPERRHHQPSHGNPRGRRDAKLKEKVVPIEVTDLELQHVQVCKPTVQKRPHLPPAAVSKRPIEVANYMKPTRSSDAKKEAEPSHTKLRRSSGAGTLQAFKERNHLAAAGAAAGKKSHHGSSNTSSSSPASRVLKTARVLKRKPSFKAITLVAKKAAGASLPPKQSVNRATCSSTLKDSRFPIALDLNPGGTDAEGISLVRVCPYTYCSLNGHAHKPLPPLKRFLSSRRKLIKAQRSMRLKGVCPIRKQGSGKGAGDMDTGQVAVSRTRSGREIARMVEELATGFFVEIYTRPEEQETEESVERANEECPEVVDKFVGTEDAMEHFNSGDDHDSSIMEEAHKIWADERFGGDKDADQNSDISIEELEMMMKCLQYVSCDQQQGADKVKEPNTVPEEFEVPDHDCPAAHGLEKGIEHVEVPGTKVRKPDNDLEENADKFPDDKSVSSAYSWGSFCPTLEDLFENENPGGESSLEPGTTLTSELRAEAIGELYHKKHEEVSEVDNTEIDLGADDSDEACVEVKFNEFTDSGLLEENDDEPFTQASEPRYSDKKCSDLGLQEVDLESDGSLAELPMLESGSAELEDTVDLDEKSKDDVDNLCHLTGDKRLGNRKIMKDGEFEDDQNSRRLTITRRTTTDDSDYMKEFNPRGPNFLPEVPDPDAEKVDLKHQMMDERKNAEEWMIDYALQQAVTKLGTRRRKKVALLVEAFETVVPLPLHEKAPEHDAPSFADPRPMQACN